jgi:hypothetical protein
MRSRPLQDVRYASDSDPIGARQRTVAMCRTDSPHAIAVQFDQLLLFAAHGWDGRISFTP